MPTKRRPLRRNAVRPRIGPDAIRLFQFVEDCIESGDYEISEEEGGRKSEYEAADRELADMVGPGWNISPCDRRLRIDPRVPQYMIAGGLCAADSWRKAVELRRQLLEAAARQADSDADLLPAFLAPKAAEK
jgi:hypothetical protein